MLEVKTRGSRGRVAHLANGPNDIITR